MSVVSHGVDLATISILLHHHKIVFFFAGGSSCCECSGSDDESSNLLRLDQRFTGFLHATALFGPRTVNISLSLSLSFSEVVK